MLHQPQPKVIGHWQLMKLAVSFRSFVLSFLLPCVQTTGEDEEEGLVPKYKQPQSVQRICIAGAEICPERRILTAGPRPIFICA